MPEATLRKPRKLVTMGFEFLKGVPTPVPQHVALKLANDPRFDVTGLDRGEVPASARSALRQQQSSLGARIRQANDRLNVEQDELFDDATGMPTVQAISSSLGFAVTKEQIASALASPKLEGETVTDPADDDSDDPEAVEDVEGDQAASAAVKPVPEHAKPVLKIKKHSKAEAKDVDSSTDGAVAIGD